MDRGNAETPVFGRPDLVFPKFALEIDGAGRGAFAVHDFKKGGTIGSYVIATVKQTEAEFF